MAVSPGALSDVRPEAAVAGWLNVRQGAARVVAFASNADATTVIISFAHNGTPRSATICYCKPGFAFEPKPHRSGGELPDL